MADKGISSLSYCRRLVPPSTLYTGSADYSSITFTESSKNRVDWDDLTLWSKILWAEHVTMWARENVMKVNSIVKERIPKIILQDLTVEDALLVYGFDHPVYFEFDVCDKERIYMFLHPDRGLPTHFKHIYWHTVPDIENPELRCFFNNVGHVNASENWDMYYLLHGWIDDNLSYEVYDMEGWFVYWQNELGHKIICESEVDRTPVFYKMDLEKLLSSA